MEFIKFDYSILDAIINDRIEIAVKKALENITIPTPSVPDTDEYICRNEARKLLGNISNPTIIQWGKDGIITCYRIGASVRYNKAELLTSFKKMQLDKQKK